MNKKTFINNKYEKKVTYANFHECSEYTLDPYWKQIFKDCGYGKFPKNTQYIDVIKTFQIKNGNETIKYKLTNDSKEDMLNIKNLLYQHLNMRSKEDRKQIKENIEEIKQQIEGSYSGEWKKIRKKNIKEAILRTYIIELQDKWDLTKEELNELFKIISLGIVFNWITDKDIVFNDKHIDGIKNLEFNKTERKFIIHKDNNEYKRVIDIKKNKLITLWDKSLDSPKNRYVY